MKAFIAAILIAAPLVAIGKDEPPPEGDIYDQFAAEEKRQAAIAKVNGTWVPPEVEQERQAGGAKVAAFSLPDPDNIVSEPTPSPTPKPIMDRVLEDFIGPLLGIIAILVIGIPALVALLCLLYIIPASLYLLARTIRRKIKEG